MIGKKLNLFFLTINCLCQSWHYVIYRFINLKSNLHWKKKKNNNTFCVFFLIRNVLTCELCELNLCASPFWP